MKSKLYDIKQKVLKRYVGTFCESTDENQAVKKIREYLQLDDSWESSYDVINEHDDVVIKFTNGNDVIEIKFLNTIGDVAGYSIVVNDRRIITKEEDDDIENIMNFVNKSTLFKDDLNKITRNLTAS